MEMVLTDRNRTEVERWREEMDGYYQLMRSFGEMELDEIYASLAGMTSRMSEIRTLLVRLQTRPANGFRTQEVDPFLNECDRQFKYFSRCQTVREFEAQLNGKVT